MRGLLLEKQKNWKEASETYQKLLAHLLASEWQSIGYKVEVHYRIAYCHDKLDEPEKAEEHLKIAMDRKDRYDADKEIEGLLVDFKEIIKMIDQLQDEIAKKKSKR